MKLTGSYIEHQVSRHCTHYFLVITRVDGSTIRTFSTFTSPPGVPLHRQAEQWARDHDHRLSIDWSTLAA